MPLRASGGVFLIEVFEDKDSRQNKRKLLIKPSKSEEQKKLSLIQERYAKEIARYFLRQRINN